MMNYEVADLFEAGEAGALIRAGKEGSFDEVSGFLGPNPGLEDE